MPHTQGNPVKVKKVRVKKVKEVKPKVEEAVVDVVPEPKLAKVKEVKEVKEKKPRKKSEWQIHLATTYEKNKGNDAKYKYSSAMKDAKLTYKKTEKTEEL